jgi:NADPH:quinone reductase-like Zn-dependent oxidoreductase
MKAITFANYGPADNLQLVDLPQLHPGPHDVLIRNFAAGVNPADSNLRDGRFRLFLRLQLPFVPGSDVAGVVAAVGAKVADFVPGQKVFAMIPFQDGGGYAEYVLADSTVVAPMPENLSFTEAGGIPLAGLTALQALAKAGSPLAGQSVLINGASGGVGTMAVQIATARGATVTAVCSARNAALAAKLGANRVLDYNSAAWAGDPATYDLVVDAAAVFSLGQGLQRTRRGGTFVSLNPGFANPLFKLIGRLRRRRVESLICGIYPEITFRAPLHEGLRALQSQVLIEGLIGDFIGAARHQITHRRVPFPKVSRPLTFQHIQSHFPARHIARSRFPGLP